MSDAIPPALPRPAADAANEPAVLTQMRSIPMRLVITIPVQGMRLRDLRGLRTGSIFTTVVPANDDVPVQVGGTLLGWAELDTVDGRMAIRLTRLS